MLVAQYSSDLAQIFEKQNASHVTSPDGRTTCAQVRCGLLSFRFLF